VLSCAPPATDDTDTAEPDGTSTSAAPVGTGSTTGDDASSGDGDGDGGSTQCLDDLTEGACTAIVVDHATACPEPCAITLDVELGCDDPSLGAHGVRAAVGTETDRATLIATGVDHAWAIEASADAGLEVVSLPPEYRDRELDAAQAPDGTVVVASAARLEPCDTSGTTSVRILHPFEPDPAERVVTETSLRRLVDLEHDASGRWRLWFEDANGTRFEQRSEGDAPTEAASDGLTFFGRFATRADETVLLSWDWNSAQMRTTLTLLPDLAAMGVSWGPGERMVAAPFPTPPPPATGDPVVSAIKQHADGVRIVTVDAGGVATEHLVPGTEAPPVVCERTPPCPATCERDTAGVLDWAAQAAYGPNSSAVWVAWVETRFDQTLELQEVCEYLSCICAATETSNDQSSADLVVAHLDLTSGAVVERLRVPTRPLAPIVAAETQPWLQLDEAGALDMRALDERMVVALRTKGPQSDDDPVVRVLQLDLAALMP
jgi:hypothetical protein